MIKLFNVPDYTVDTSKFSNLLHDKIVTQVEERVADYVGAKYAVAVSSCTAGIFLALKFDDVKECTIPSLVTTRFLSAIRQADAEYKFKDKTDWVGGDYRLTYRIIDSAQRFDPAQMEDYTDGDVVIFSNYPTKPVGGLKGGFVVSDDEKAINWIRQAAYFGEDFNNNSWDAKPGFMGWQLYMNSVEAWFVNESLNRYEAKRKRLDEIREAYTGGKWQRMTMDSYHLYRIYVKDNVKFMGFMLAKGIQTGIHYRAAHLDPVYGQDVKLPESERQGREVASIPFHEKLTDKEVKHIIESVNQWYDTL